MGAANRERLLWDSCHLADAVAAWGHANSDLAAVVSPMQESLPLAAAAS